MSMASRRASDLVQYRVMCFTLMFEFRRTAARRHFYDFQAETYHSVFNRARSAGHSVHSVLYRDRKLSGARGQRGRSRFLSGLRVPDR